MNIANAVGFLVLGMLMHVSHELAAWLSVSAEPFAAPADSIRTVWLELMGWVIGGIGSGYLLKEGAYRLPALIALVVPERLLRPVSASAESLPAGARIGVSN